MEMRAHQSASVCGSWALRGTRAGRGGCCVCPWGVGGGGRGGEREEDEKGLGLRSDTGTHSGDGRMLSRRRAIFWLLDVLTLARAQSVPALPFFSSSPSSPSSTRRLPPGPASPSSVLFHSHRPCAPTARQLQSAITKANMSGRVQKQSMSELKLRRLTEHNQRLKEDLARPRIRVSEASRRYALIL